MPPIQPETDASLRERVIAELRKRKEFNGDALTAIGVTLDAIGHRYGITRSTFTVQIDSGPAVKVHRYWNETWQAEYTDGPVQPHAIDDREKLVVEVPIDLWERLQRAEKELEDVRELIATYFPND